MILENTPITWWKRIVAAFIFFIHKSFYLLHMFRASALIKTRSFANAKFHSRTFHSSRLFNGNKFHNSFYNSTYKTFSTNVNNDNHFDNNVELKKKINDLEFKLETTQKKIDALSNSSKNLVRASAKTPKDEFIDSFYQSASFASPTIIGVATVAIITRLI